MGTVATACAGVRKRDVLKIQKRIIVVPNGLLRRPVVRLDEPLAERQQLASLFQLNQYCHENYCPSTISTSLMVVLEAM